MSVKNYTDADNLLTGRCRERRKVANNTWLERRDDDEIAVKLHDTDVVTYRADGSITLDTGGWFTVTTKARLNEFSPFGVWSRRGEWQVATRNPNYDRHYDGPWPNNPYWGDPVPYRDGMTWRAGEWTGIPEPDDLDRERAERKQQRAAINRFVKGITPERIVTAFENPEGDCWMCRFDMAGGDCLASHVEEDYFHAHLALRAITAAGYRSPEVIMHMVYSDAQRGRVDDTLTRALRKLLTRALIEGVAVR